MSQNRRKFIRIDAGSTPCQITIGQDCSKAILVNESIYGLCVGGLDLMFLAADQQVIVEYESERIIGRCRSASKDANGSFQIGILKTEDDFKREVSQILVNSFMDFGGCKIVCLPLGMQPDGQVRIRLIDGKEFSVEKCKIVQMTRPERQAEFTEDPSDLGRLLKIYSALDDSRNWTCEGDILDLEFGTANQPSLARV